MNLEPSWDPLGYTTDLPLRETLYPLGFSLQIETNSPEVLASARLSWPGSTAKFPDPPLRIRVNVSDAGKDDGSLPAPSAHAQGHLFTLVAGEHDFAACDVERGFAFAVVRDSTARNSKYFRFYYLECLTYIMLSWHRLTAIHASCVSDGESAVLFCGKSGAGKSCLAYACARGGLEFISDDAVYLVRGDANGMVLGKPQWLRLKESSVSLFPELRAFSPALDVNGEQVIELATAAISGMTTRETARQARVVLLERQPEAASPRLERIDPEEALQLLVRELPRWEASVSREQVDSVRQMLAGGAHRLIYSDLAPAVEAIKRLLRQD
jgi:hypothetical protein